MEIHAWDISISNPHGHIPTEGMGLEKGTGREFRLYSYFYLDTIFFMARRSALEGYAGTEIAISGVVVNNEKSRLLKPSIKFMDGGTTVEHYYESENVRNDLVSVENEMYCKAITNVKLGNRSLIVDFKPYNCSDKDKCYEYNFGAFEVSSEINLEFKKSFIGDFKKLAAHVNIFAPNTRFHLK